MVGGGRIVCLAMALALAGCSVERPDRNAKSATSNARPVGPEQPAAIRPSDDAAVLFFHENAEFASQHDFTGGPAVYSNEVFGLADALRSHGIAAQVLRVPDFSFPLAKLQQFRAIYVMNTFLIYEELKDRMDAYVRHGGLLVGICEVGRHQGGWTDPWPFGETFGLTTLPIDTYGTGLSFSGDHLYRDSEIAMSDSPLFRGVSRPLDWGEAAEKIWGTVPAGAAVHAFFSRHVFVERNTAKATVMDRPVPALTVHSRGEGTAIFLAVKPTATATGDWKSSGQAGLVLANAMRYARHAFSPSGEPAVTTVPGYDQLGYEPGDPKTIVLRFQGVQEGARVHGAFAVRDADGQIVLQAPLQTWTGHLWRSEFLTADFTALTNEGIYAVEFTLPEGVAMPSSTVAIRPRIRAGEILPSQIDFFHAMRSGSRAHTNDPVRGGFMDASGDWAVRMWSMPHVIWCMTRCLETFPGNTALLEELRWGLQACLGMQGPDGATYTAIRSESGTSPIEMRPAEDRTQRLMDTSYSFNDVTTYAAALARAARFLRPIAPALGSNCLAAARAAFARSAREEVTTTADLGNRAWAALELRAATDDDSCLEAARRDVEQYLDRQLPPGRVRDAAVHGNFFADGSLQTFAPQQWKVFHGIGIYLALIELERLLGTDDPLRTRVRVALDAFAEGHLLGMSSLSPYGQMALGLEPAGGGQFRVYHFSHEGAWVLDHGLNCDMLAMALLGLERTRGTDRRFRELGIRQVQWLLGRNPLGYSMIEGFGVAPAPPMDPALGTGPIRGGIPNGIVGRGPDNLPVWGSSWGSREYWLPHNAYLLALLASLHDAASR